MDKMILIGCFITLIILFGFLARFLNGDYKKKPPVKPKIHTTPSEIIDDLLVKLNKLSKKEIERERE